VKTKTGTSGQLAFEDFCADTFLVQELYGAPLDADREDPQPLSESMT
jgi:hypothetical protein